MSNDLLTAWISVKEKLPNERGLFLVANERESQVYLALWSWVTQTFHQHEPSIYTKPPIDVTHWIQLPPSPFYDKKIK